MSGVYKKKSRCTFVEIKLGIHGIQSCGVYNR